MTPEQRVRALVEAGTMSQTEGSALLAALDEAAATPSATVPASRPRVTELLFSPYERFGGGVAAAVGGLVAIASVLVTRRGVRMDGLLDLHKVATAPTWKQALLDQAGGFIAPVCVAWLVAIAFRGRGRWIDFVGAVGLARLPNVLAAGVLAILVTGVDPSHRVRASIALAGAVSVALGAIAWGLVLHYRGFVNASGLARNRRALAFVVFIVAAEIASKIVDSFAS